MLNFIATNIRQQEIVLQNDRHAQIDAYRRIDDPRIRSRVEKARQAAEQIALQKKWGIGVAEEPRRTDQGKIDIHSKSSYDRRTSTSSNYKKSCLIVRYTFPYLFSIVRYKWQQKVQPLECAIAPDETRKIVEAEVSD